MYKRQTVEWTAVNSGSHDIEGNESSYEVKSTVKRYGATTVSYTHLDVYKRQSSGNQRNS